MFKEKSFEHDKKRHNEMIGIENEKVESDWVKKREPYSAHFSGRH